MIRLIASSAYIAATWKYNEAEGPPAAKKSDGIQRRKTAPINVPMISNGTVEGYIVAQFVYLADEGALREMSVPPDDFITDEAFRELYSSNVDFNHLEKYDVERLTKALTEKINHRLEKDIIKAVLVAEFTYIPKRDVSQ
jgi:hypothetical protein